MRKIYLLLVMILLEAFVVGCGRKVADEEQIQVDLEGYVEESCSYIYTL